MDKRLVPTMYIERFDSITPQLLAEMNIIGLFADLDETLVGHGVSKPSSELMAWLCKLKANGISVCILSNNSAKRTGSFALDAGIPYLSRCFKPNIFVARSAFGIINLKPEQTAVVGDQVFTDLKLAVNLGIRCFLTEPIGTTSTLYVRYKRFREKKYKRIYTKAGI